MSTTLSLSSFLTTLGVALLLHCSELSAKPVFDVREYGAAGDSVTKDTEAIQRTIDAAAKDGAGIVYFSKGRYLTGTLFMKSGVTLHLDNDAVILGSTDLKDFPVTWPATRSYTDKYVNRSLLYGEALNNIAIVGTGIIDGQGGSFADSSYMIRPYLIRFVKCRDILVEGITLRDSPMWVQHYLGCDFVRITGLTVHSQVNRNNDMLDIDGCHNVIISDCFADTEDDAITLKSSFERTTENVTVTNCVLSSQCNAIKLGTESNGGFKNISISNCVIDSSYKTRTGFLDREKGRSGISLLLVDGGILENITINNISMSGVTVPIFLRLGNRGRRFRDDMPKPAVGSFRDVIISDVTFRDVGNLGCSITGLPGHEIENVTLHNLRMAFPGKGLEEDAGRQIPELETDYPAAAMFGRLPAWGLYCRHVKGLKLSQLDLRLEDQDQRPSMVFEDVSQLDMDSVSVSGDDSAGSSMLLLRDVKNALVRGCRPSPRSRTFLRLEGNSENVSAVSNQLLNISPRFEFGDGVSREVLYEFGNGPR